jgi:hypothetical protein
VRAHNSRGTSLPPSSCRLCPQACVQQVTGPNHSSVPRQPCTHNANRAPSADASTGGWMARALVHCALLQCPPVQQVITCPDHNIHPLEHTPLRGVYVVICGASACVGTRGPPGIGLPWDACSLPWDACSLPWDACSLPWDACSLPWDACNLPWDACGLPWTACGLP